MTVATPLSPPSAPVQGRLQSPPAKSKFLAFNLLQLQAWNSPFCNCRRTGGANKQERLIRAATDYLGAI
ncbi:MAG: hypothetical protein ACJA16_001921 [Akkermansiaceae bacterium]|jgi:hypothetical protein